MATMAVSGAQVTQWQAWVLHLAMHGLGSLLTTQGFVLPLCPLSYPSPFIFQVLEAFESHTLLQTLIPSSNAPGVLSICSALGAAWGGGGYPVSKPECFLLHWAQEALGGQVPCLVAKRPSFTPQVNHHLPKGAFCRSPAQMGPLSPLLAIHSLSELTQIGLPS